MNKIQNIWKALLLSVHFVSVINHQRDNELHVVLKIIAPYLYTTLDIKFAVKT